MPKCFTDDNHKFDPEEQWYCPQCGKHKCDCGRDYDDEPEPDECHVYYDGR